MGMLKTIVGAGGTDGSLITVAGVRVAFVADGFSGAIGVGVGVFSGATDWFKGSFGACALNMNRPPLMR